MADDLRTFAADLGRARLSAIPAIRAVVAKGAVNVKTQMRADAAKSAHFAIATTISYDLAVGGLAAEIGPVTGGAGSLANIAYFGGVNGGGGTLPDPQLALDAEAPKFEQALADVVEKGLR